MPTRLYRGTAASFFDKALSLAQSRSRCSLCEAKTEFYAHDQSWSNRMILGDSLSVMASLAEREGLRGQVQCIYLDPPYGIKFNSNFQWSTTSRDVKDGAKDHITREPEQVRAFRRAVYVP
jgi:adenine-specific DNA-methyltransferase